jgi:phosphoribosyl 1,2-cyclic phosphodiesterase
MRDDAPQVASVIDAGTGIRGFGKALKALRKYDEIDIINVVFTHFHWDHIQGFPFFDPAYDPSIQIRVMAMGVGRDFKDLKQIFSDQMQERYFPVKLEDMGADMQFVYPDSDTRLVGAANVDVIEQNHPGGSWGYRIKIEDKVIVICTDLEHGENIDMRIVEFAKGADLLVHEAQYTNEELKAHRDWGHSSYDQAMEVARLAEVGYLVMTHHDPDHDDTFLFAREMECQTVMSNCCLAREGLEIRL